MDLKVSSSRLLQPEVDIEDRRRWAPRGGSTNKQKYVVSGKLRQAGRAVGRELYNTSQKPIQLVLGEFWE